MSEQQAGFDPFNSDRIFDGAAPTELVELLAALRSQSTPSELSGEQAIVAQMRRAIEESRQFHPPREVASTQAGGRGVQRRRLTRTAVAAAIGVLSLGGVAAAATGANPFSPILSNDDGPRLEVPETSSSTTSSSSTSSTSPSSTSSTSTTSTSTTTRRADDDKSVDDDKRAATDPVACDDADNHGEHVSSVARSGGNVVEAAHSDCGKPKTSTSTSTTTRKVEDDKDDDDDKDESEDKSESSSKGKGSEKSGETKGSEDRKGSNKGKG